MSDAEIGLLLKLAEHVSKTVANKVEYNQIQTLCQKVAEAYAASKAVPVNAYATSADPYAARNSAPVARAPAPASR